MQEDEIDTRTGKVYQDNLLNMPGAASIIPEIVVIEPRDLSETSQAIQALREWKIVILKLTWLEPKVAQRAADFVTGGTYAIDGHTQWIGERTFLFTPRSVQVSTQGQSLMKREQGTPSSEQGVERYVPQP